MKFEFHVLWIEDQPGNVDGQREAIDRMLRKQGFRLTTTFKKTFHDAQAVLGDSLFTDHVDLILLDYNLGSEDPKLKNLAEVRETLPHKDLLLYSASAAKTLQTHVAEARVQGVFWCSRDQLKDEVEGIFDNLLKKVLDIDHSRGIVMGTTSHIDFLIDQSLEIVSKSLPREALQAAKTILEKISTDQQTRFRKLQSSESVDMYLKDHFVFSSAKRLDLLRKLLPRTSVDEDLQNQLTKYVSSQQSRNVLGHVRAKSDPNKGRVLVDKNGTEYDEVVMRQLRMNLLSHLEAFEKIASLLDSWSKRANT